MAKVLQQTESLGLSRLLALFGGTLAMMGQTTQDADYLDYSKPQKHLFTPRTGELPMLLRCRGISRLLRRRQGRREDGTGSGCTWGGRHRFGDVVVPGVEVVPVGRAVVQARWATWLKCVDPAVGEEVLWCGNGRCTGRAGRAGNPRQHADAAGR